MIRVAAVHCLFFLLASSAAAQWRSVPVVDDLTGQRTLVALADGRPLGCIPRSAWPSSG